MGLGDGTLDLSWAAALDASRNWVSPQGIEQPSPKASAVCTLNPQPRIQTTIVLMVFTKEHQGTIVLLRIFTLHHQLNRSFNGRTEG